MPIGHGDAEINGPLPEPEQTSLNGPIGAHWVGGVGSLHHVVGGAEIPDRRGQGAHVVEADTEEGRAGPGEPAVRGLEPEDSTEGGGDANG